MQKEQSVSEKDKHTLTGWLIGVATTVAIAVAAWSLLATMRNSEATAVLGVKQETNFDSVKELKKENEQQHQDIKADIKEVKADIKLLLAR